MGKTLDGKLTPKIAAFIAEQHVFFVGTAPLSAAHHVNLSPKADGGSSLAVLDSTTLAFADLSGSGSETAAHVLQNGRITFMFVNFGPGAPQIIRVFGTASLLLPAEVPAALLTRFGADTVASPGFRAVFVTRVHRVSHSCGYSMPVLRFERARTLLYEHSRQAERPASEGGGYVVRTGRGAYADGRRLSGMGEYRALKNSFSIDGLPSVALAMPGAKPARPVPSSGFLLAAPVTAATDGAEMAAKAEALVAEVRASLARRPVELPQLEGAAATVEPPVAAVIGTSQKSSAGRADVQLGVLAVGAAIGCALGWVAARRTAPVAI